MSVRSGEIDGVELVILPSVRDLGDGFSVRGALPSAHRQTVGPFVVFDRMAPAAFRGGKGLDVGPLLHVPSRDLCQPLSAGSLAVERVR